MTSQKPVLVLNVSYEILAYCSWQKAVAMLVSEEARTLDHHPTEVVRSQHITLPMPEVVILNQYVLVPYKDMLREDEKMATRSGILRRDKFVCQYCGDSGYTIDHIWPQSLGGETTWENCVVACRDCNLKKSNMVPQDAELLLGMKLQKPPKPPAKRNEDIQKQIYKKYATK